MSFMFLLTILVFVFTTLSQIKLDEIKEVLTRSITKTEGNSSLADKLEAGSLVRSADLYTYLAFSADDSLLFNESNRTTISKGIIAINEDLVLSPPFVNDCDELYCLQSRRPFREIPSMIWRGLIGIEDIRFLSHVGFDFKAIARAVVKDIMAFGFVEGGSTITQQLAKNLFLSSEKSIWRKLKELIVAVSIEVKFEKEEIIQAYLNEVYWGVLQGINVKGFHAASFLYFQKRPRDLEVYEATILVSLLKGPSFYHPIRNMERLKSRVSSVWKSLIDKNVIDSSEAIWSDDQWSKWSEGLAKLEKKGERPLYSWWLSTKIDNGPMEPFGKFVFIRGAESILAISKEKAPDTDLAVKAVVKSWSEKTETKDYFQFYSKFERDRIIATTQERHQVGSTLKPLIYSELINLGYDLNSMVDTSEINLNLLSGKWSPQESHHVEEPEISIAEALRQSLNRPIIRLAKDVGFEKLEQKLLPKIPHLKTPLGQYPSQLLGAVEMSLEELALAYQGFFDEQCGEVGSGIINVLDDPNQTTIKRVVGKVMSQMRFFGKTGTTNGGRDNWFVFFDGRFISVIWVGQETERSGKSLPLYGSSTAFRILENYLLYRGKLFNDLHCVASLKVQSEEEL